MNSLHGNAYDRNPSAKLTWQDVFSIRVLAGEMPQKKLAELFGVSQFIVSRIINNLNWRV